MADIFTKARAQGSGYQDQEGSPSQKKVQEIFATLTESLEKYGVSLDTGHKRILIPKTVLEEQDITETLGFVPVDVAVPEAGQTRFESFRHPDIKYHLHEHGKYWTMHEDVHEASTMLVEKLRRQKGSVSIFEQAKQFGAGLPHLIGEGVPSLFYYIKGQIEDLPPMAQRLAEELPVQYKALMGKLAEKRDEARGYIERGAKWIGRGISNLFSGKDDAYNTIEGLREEGETGQLRKINTDFGSGYQGPRRSAAYFQQQEENYRAWSYPTRPRSPESFYIGSREISEHYSKHVAADLSYHNWLDAHWDPKTKTMALQASQGLREPSKSPVTRGYLERGYNWLATKGRWKTGVGLLAAGVAVNSFSGFDDNYNTIEGFQELGLSAAQRKILTEFGSGYSPKAMWEILTKFAIKKRSKGIFQVAEAAEQGVEGVFFRPRIKTTAKESAEWLSKTPSEEQLHRMYAESWFRKVEELERKRFLLKEAAPIEVVRPEVRISPRELKGTAKEGTLFRELLAEKKMELPGDIPAGRGLMTEELKRSTSREETKALLAAKIAPEEATSSVTAAARPSKMVPLGEAATERMALVAQDLQTAQEAIWVNIGGARHHVRRKSSRSVVSLSKHDKSVK